MPEATQDIHDSLDASVAALVGDPAAAPSPASAAPASTEIDFDSLAADAVANLVSDSAKSPPPLDGDVASLVADAQSAAPDLAEAVGKLIEEAPAPAAETPPQPAPDKIETLDAQIANLADDLIAGEFADEQSALQGELGKPPAAPAALSEPAPPPTAATAEPAPKPPPPEPKVAAPAKAPAPTPATPVAAPATAKPDRLAAPRKAAEAAAKIAARQGAQAAAGLGPIGIGLLAILSKPLRKKPKAVQDLIGWVALITLFNALCLWGYILFFRSAHPPAAAQTTVAKAEAGHGAPAGHEAKSGHEPKAAGHGKAPDKKSAKAPPAKKAPAKKEAKGKAPPAKSGGH